jgi:hypothetical protein
MQLRRLRRPFFVGALAKLQAVFGAIPKAATVGEHANGVRELMNGILGQARTRSVHAPQIDTLIVIDRLVDLVTPLATTWIVDGHMDVAFGIRHGFGLVPVSQEAPHELRRLDNTNVCFQNVHGLTDEAAVHFLNHKSSERMSLSEELAQGHLLDYQARWISYARELTSVSEFGHKKM